MGGLPPGPLDPAGRGPLAAAGGPCPEPLSGGDPHLRPAVAARPVPPPGRPAAEHGRPCFSRLRLAPGSRGGEHSPWRRLTSTARRGGSATPSSPGRGTGASCWNPPSPSRPGRGLPRDRWRHRPSGRPLPPTTQARLRAPGREPPGPHGSPGGGPAGAEALTGGRGCPLIPHAPWTVSGLGGARRRPPRGIVQGLPTGDSRCLLLASTIDPESPGDGAVQLQDVPVRRESLLSRRGEP